MAYTREQSTEKEPQRNEAEGMASSSSNGGVIPGELTPWNVMKAIPGTIGSFDLIARKLNLPRLEVRKYIMGNKELREAIDDDILAAQERIRLQTYKDGLDGQPQARQDFFKMVNGYFEKRETAASQKSNEPKTNIVLHIEPKPNTYKMLGAGGDLVDIDISALKGNGVDSPVSSGENAVFAGGVKPVYDEPDDGDDMDIDEEEDDEKKDDEDF